METNNKLIVEFLEWDVLNDMAYSKITKGKWVELNKLKFHTSWDWLMQVVEKIESIKIETYKVRVDIYFNCCQINPTHWEQLISIYGNKETKIEAVYNACIEFIKWYNENSAKEK